MHSVLMCMCTVCTYVKYRYTYTMNVTTLHVYKCTVHVVQLVQICTYIHLCGLMTCQTRVLYIQMYVSNMCVYMQLFLSTLFLYIHILQLFFMYMWSTCSYLMCNALLVVCSLYRTGLIKDLLLCSGYRDSSSLRPS